MNRNRRSSTNLAWYAYTMLSRHKCCQFFVHTHFFFILFVLIFRLQLVDYNCIMPKDISNVLHLGVSSGSILFWINCGSHWNRWGQISRFFHANYSTKIDLFFILKLFAISNFTSQKFKAINVTRDDSKHLIDVIKMIAFEKDFNNESCFLQFINKWLLNGYTFCEFRFLYSS